MQGWVGLIRVARNLATSAHAEVIIPWTVALARLERDAPPCIIGPVECAAAAAAAAALEIRWAEGEVVPL
jgi:hypothetical protein